MDKKSLLEEFKLFSLGTGGIGNWISEKTAEDIFLRLGNIESEPLKKVQLNQLLVLGHEAPVSDDFFSYYWLSIPDNHPFPVDSIPKYDKKWIEDDSIVSIQHLKWGLYRLFVDSLLYFGNVRSGYRFLRSLNFDELEKYFKGKRYNSKLIKSRGPSLPLNMIAKDKRYLISEMACKSYGENPKIKSDLKRTLVESFKKHQSSGGGHITIGELLSSDKIQPKYQSRQQEFEFSVSEILDEKIKSEADIEAKYLKLSDDFSKARSDALDNTRKYLSMVGDLDVYIATSMRNRKDFRDMATRTETIFSDPSLKKLDLRYFDPTLSAASCHEDKGLIECLMVKCASVLLYCAGEKESYGKDAEAAMALSLGKPVIFLCDHKQKTRFYKEVHPLSRLIHFDTGIAVGAMVTDQLSEVVEILYRIFENKMEYELDHPKKGYLRLLEKVTKSSVRLQTNDMLLAETFWNHYHGSD